MLIGSIVTPSIASSRPSCSNTLRSVQNSLPGIVSFKQRKIGNMGQPPGRSQALDITFKGFEEYPGESIRKSSATRVINSCNKIASVSFGVDQTDAGSVYGLKKGKVIQFTCIEAGGSQTPKWGETYCP
jgi:hypothetical protein